MVVVLFGKGRSRRGRVAAAALRPGPLVVPVLHRLLLAAGHFGRRARPQVVVCGQAVVPRGMHADARRRQGVVDRQQRETVGCARPAHVQSTARRGPQQVAQQRRAEHRIALHVEVDGLRRRAPDCRPKWGGIRETCQLRSDGSLPCPPPPSNGWCLRR